MSMPELCARYRMALELIIELWDAEPEIARKIASLALEDKDEDEQAGAMD